MKIVAVTSCPSGVAHTYLAAEALKMAGRKLNVEVFVETQGAAGIENQLNKKDIDEAVCVILTSDTTIRNEERFKGKKILRMEANKIISDSLKLMKKIKITFEQSILICKSKNTPAFLLRDARRNL